MTGTVAERIYAVRLALGDGVRKPLSLRRFAVLLSERAGGERNFSPSQLSTWETGAAVPQLSDIATIAAVDPKGRGAGWLAFGEPASADPSVEIRPPGWRGQRVAGPEVPAEVKKPPRRAGGGK